MSQLTARDKIVAHLDEYLRIDEVPDKSPNGLQVQGRDAVSTVAFAVDASLQTITEAANAGADMLIVHHGLWWGEHEQIVGRMHGRIAALINADLSLYAAHIPLDCHPRVGNNVELARLFDLDVDGTFGDYHGIEVGVCCSPRAALALDALLTRIEEVLDSRPQVLRFGPESVERVAIVSGHGSGCVDEARARGCDTLITGESSHSAFHSAKECRINLIFGGHYATETVGLVALARHLEDRYALTCRFIPAPTGY